MGIFLNQGVKGNLSYEEGAVVFNGINSKGVKVNINITGGYEDGKVIPLNVKDFKDGFKNLIIQSAELSIKKTTNGVKKQQIRNELDSRLKSFENGKEISININESMGFFIPDKDVLVMSAVGTPKTTKKGRIFYNIKPIEDEKLTKNFIPVKTAVYAMVMQRENFNNLSDEEKKSIKYKKNSSDAINWRWKKISVSDHERGIVDYSTVQMNGVLIKSFSKPKDLIDILGKDEAYIDYMTTQMNKKIRGSYDIVEEHEKSDVVVPRVSIFVPEYKIFSEVGVENKKELLKKIFEKANKNAPSDNRFYIPFEGENNNLKIDETNIESIQNDRIIKDTFKTILSQFEYKYADLVDFIGIEDTESQVMQYLKATDAVHTAKNRKDYVNATKHLFKMINRDSLNNAPITVSFPMSVHNYILKDNPIEQKREADAIKNEINKMVKDIVTPLEKVFVRQITTENKSEYIQKIKDNISKVVSINFENKKIIYNENEKGFTLKDNMFIEVESHIFNSDGFITSDGKKIPSTGFTAIRVPLEKEENNDTFVGISGLGGRNYKYVQSEKVLSNLGMNYISHPIKNLHVNKNNIPVLQRNPITGEDMNVKIKIQKENSPKKEPSAQSPVSIATEMPKNEEKILGDNSINAIEEQEKTDETLIVAKESDIKDEMLMSLGDGIDIDELLGFLDDDEIDIQRANEVSSSRHQDGVSNIAP